MVLREMGLCRSVLRCGVARRAADNVTQIVKLDLRVDTVYEQVWARSAAAQGYAEGNSPMVVIYRLQG